jgi:site-specific DNA-methyltransferase (adenine-specific)
MSLLELRTGSCLDPIAGLPSLPDGSVDVFIADPPYEAEAHSLQRRTKPTGWRKREVQVECAPLKFDAITEDERDAVAREMGRVVTKRVLVFCQVEAVHLWRASLNGAGLVYRRCIPWVKPDAMPSLHGRWPGQAFEALVLATVKGSARCPVGGKARYYEHQRAQKRVHDTQKPLGLMRQIVEDFSEPGDLVCDPYAGSGTTGIACRALGRRFLGWEIDEAMADKARARIHGEALPGERGQVEMFRVTKGR